VREARASAGLRHPNVVQVYDVMAEGDSVMLVMELLEGESLRTYLERNAQPNYAEFISLMLPALEAIAAAHAHGVIHRDLKPENIVLEPSGSSGQGLNAKVLDFGIAASSTDPGELAGTPLYMSPEALHGADAGERETRDVYALGVMFYEGLTGIRPHEAATLSELVIKVSDEPIVPIRQHRPDVPEKLAQVVESALAKIPKQRIPSVRRLIDELAPFADGSARAWRARPAKAEARPVLTTQNAFAASAVRHRRMTTETAAPARTAFALLALLAAVTIAAIVVLSALREPKPPLQVQALPVTITAKPILTLEAKDKLEERAGTPPPPNPSEPAQPAPAFRRGSSPATQSAPAKNRPQSGEPKKAPVARPKPTLDVLAF
jgi:serine/threonine-protein kinase